MQPQLVNGIDDTTNQRSNVLMAWIVGFAASLFFFYEFILGNMFASIADDIMRDFHIQADKMAYLSSIHYLSNVIFLLVAGQILDRYSAKKTIIFAMILCVVSTFLLASSQSFYVALFCRFLTGIGSAFCFLGPMRIVSRWFPPKKMALVTGAVVTMAMTGGLLSQYPLTKLVLQFGWRESLVFVGWLGMALLVMMVVWIKNQPKGYQFETDQNKSVIEVAKQAYFNPQTFRAAMFTSLMNMAVAVFGAMMGSLYLMQRLGVGKEQAAMVNSMLFLGAIFGGPIIGWCSDRLGKRILPMKIGLIASFVVIMAILLLPVSLNVMTVLFFLLGFFTASQVISYALVAESSPPAMTATALSLISILTQGGYIIYQNLFSHLLIWHGGVTFVNDAPVYSFGDYQTAALMIPIGLIVAWVAIGKLKETHCQQIQKG
jgi:MFS family permease